MEEVRAPTPAELEQTFLPWPSVGMEDDGQPMAGFGIRMSYFMRQPRERERELRRAMLAIVEEYLGLAQGRIRRYAYLGDKRDRFVAQGGELDLNPLRKLTETDDSWGIEMSATTGSGEPSHWALNTLIAQVPHRPDELDQLLFYLPFTTLQGWPPGTWHAMFQRHCTALAVEHAYAGFGFVLPIDVGGEAGAMNVMGAHAMRFQGLDIDAPSWTAIKCEQGIRCVSFLTAVSNRLLDRIGGAAAVMAAAGVSARRIDYGNGTIFQAGDMPQIGDTTQGLVPQAYVAMGRALKALRSPYTSRIFEAPPGHEAPPGVDPAYDFSQRWLARFDGS